MCGKLIKPKSCFIAAIIFTLLLCLYYVKNISSGDATVFRGTSSPLHVNVKGTGKHFHCESTCQFLKNTEADINTVQIFKQFDFQPTWIKSREYWDKSFEERYEKQKTNDQRGERYPLKVIIVPHSHNDPGWLKTFETYFNYQSRLIINNMVSKLEQHANLTFIWSEVSFLHSWWEGAHPSRQRALKALVESGRLEITTGGWVMTDEANVHVFAMVDQMIEGHQWILQNLGVKPKTGWSIDPFGHGPIQPFIMANAGMTGAVIQRIHYAWKQWLAKNQLGDFNWIPNWSPHDLHSTILTHNQPYDIYSIKHSCGPHPYICLNFDFRKVQGEYTEYSIKAQPITQQNIKERSELLLEQYSRTGSLYPHNVVLMPLGDDFRYNVAEEWDQQYNNYMQIMNFINSNYGKYRTNITFGTPSDYFKSVRERSPTFPTLKGDFFVYSDIFSEGRPAYWSGYYTTRPFMKILSRQLEHNLRSTEIIYTLALNQARQRDFQSHLKVTERNFEKLVQARRNLGLFQHHDAITGTSKAFVMRDYGLKLFDSIRDTDKIQQDALQSFLLPKTSSKGILILLSDLERDSFEKIPRKSIINIGSKTRQIVIYNTVSHIQHHFVQLKVDQYSVKVLDTNGNIIQHQINPVWDSSESNTNIMQSSGQYELSFVAKLLGFSISVFNITADSDGLQSLATIFCSKCSNKHMNNSKFNVQPTKIGDIELENHKLRLQFSGSTGFLQNVFRKSTRIPRQCALKFAAYRSAQFHSGAYLFMPDPNEREIEHDILNVGGYAQNRQVVISSGPVASDITLYYGTFLIHTIRIFHIQYGILSDAIYIENEVDFGTPPNNRETELFMRLETDVQNGDPPIFYTDSNGYQMQKRIKTERIGIEGNYYPITSQAYIEDDELRISLLTNHAQGAASWLPGQLEVMLDRRTLYDDSRGMGEGVVDNRRTIFNFWLLLEETTKVDEKTVSNVITPELPPRENERDDPDFEQGDTMRTFNVINDAVDNEKESAYSDKTTESVKNTFSRPSVNSNHLANAINYPPKVFVVDYENGNNLLQANSNWSLFTRNFPCDIHLLTLRTQPDPTYSQFPSQSAFLVLHRQGQQCGVGEDMSSLCGENPNEFDGVSFNDIVVQKITATSLTGLEQHDTVTDFGKYHLPPMTLQTFNITFG